MHQIKLHGPWLLSASRLTNENPSRCRYPCDVPAEIWQSGFRLARKFHAPTGIESHQTIELFFELSVAPQYVSLNGNRIESNPSTSIRLNVTEKLESFNQIEFEFDCQAGNDPHAKSVLLKAGIEIHAQSQSDAENDF